MKNVLIAVGILLALIVAGFLFIVTVKNGLISQEEKVRELWSSIDTQLQRRADLIPNLVNTVKGYAKHEKEIFENVAKARSEMLAAKTPEGKAAAGNVMQKSLVQLLAVAERYPDLKANQNFIRLQDELAGTENRIAVSRTRYNRSVREFNAAIRQFPGSLFAEGMELKKAQYFQPPEGSAAVSKVPGVSF